MAHGHQMSRIHDPPVTIWAGIGVQAWTVTLFCFCSMLSQGDAASFCRVMVRQLVIKIVDIGLHGIHVSLLIIRMQAVSLSTIWLACRKRNA